MCAKSFINAANAEGTGYMEVDRVACTICVHIGHIIYMYTIYKYYIRKRVQHGRRKRENVPLYRSLRRLYFLLFFYSSYFPDLCCGYILYMQNSAKSRKWIQYMRKFNASVLLGVLVRIIVLFCCNYLTKKNVFVHLKTLLTMYEKNYNYK